MDNLTTLACIPPGQCGWLPEEVLAMIWTNHIATIKDYENARRQDNVAAMQFIGRTHDKFVAFVDDDEDIESQLALGILHEHQQVFVLIPDEYGNQFDGYAKIDNKIYRHGPSFFVSPILSDDEETLIITSYVTYHKNRNVGGLTEKIFSNRIDYNMSMDDVIATQKRLAAEFAPKVAWTLCLPVCPCEPYPTVFDGGSVSDYPNILC